MCGIAGVWNLRSDRVVETEVIRRMTRTLVHRGPDDEGWWVDGPVGLGMRRLAVIDPASGQQPMRNEDGSVVLVFNGEVYGHPALREELLGLGHDFRTASDTEVILRAFEQWGEECLDRLDGMFALAIFDVRRRRLLLARDRLGIKPLYVFNGPHGVIFGSELKAVMASEMVDREFDLDAIDDFMTYEYVPAPASIIRGVRKLRPAHRLLYTEENPDRIGERRYWKLQAADPTAHSVGEAVDAFRERLETSVARRLISDVPLGAFLSGGVDSSAIVAAMSRRTGGERLRTFSIGFSDRSYDERSYAREVASHFGTNHIEEVVSPDVVELAVKISGHFDEPFADVSAFPMYWLSALARTEVTVALSGDGGDELLAGCSPVTITIAPIGGRDGSPGWHAPEAGNSWTGCWTGSHRSAPKRDRSTSRSVSPKDCGAPPIWSMPGGGCSGISSSDGSSIQNHSGNRSGSGTVSVRTAPGCAKPARLDSPACSVSSMPI
jgi:asparagine synthase (glutamine-hydrolysing)